MKGMKHRWEDPESWWSRVLMEHQDMRREGLNRGLKINNDPLRNGRPTHRTPTFPPTCVSCTAGRAKQREGATGKEQVVQDPEQLHCLLTLLSDSSPLNQWH